MIPEDQLAKKYAVDVTPVEEGLIRAIAARIQKPHPVTQREYDRWDNAYSDAMRVVYKEYPDNHDVAALFAEAMMTRTPWKLWDVYKGEPPPDTDTYEILDVLESSIRELKFSLALQQAQLRSMLKTWLLSTV